MPPRELLDQTSAARQLSAASRKTRAPAAGRCRAGAPLPRQALRARCDGSAACVNRAAQLERRRIEVKNHNPAHVKPEDGSPRNLTNILVIVPFNGGSVSRMAYPPARQTACVRKQVTLKHRNLPLLTLQAREQVIGHPLPVGNAHGITEQQWRIVPCSARCGSARAARDRGTVPPVESQPCRGPGENGRRSVSLPARASPTISAGCASRARCAAAPILAHRASDRGGGRRRVEGVARQGVLRTSVQSSP